MYLLGAVAGGAETLLARRTSSAGLCISMTRKNFAEAFSKLRVFLEVWDLVVL